MAPCKPGFNIIFGCVFSVDLDQLRALRQYFQQALRAPEHDHNDDTEPQYVAPVDPQSHHLHHRLLPRRREPNLSHAHFTEALERADCFFASDRAIFDRLFTLLDRTGDGEIYAAEFLVGVCALLHGDLVSKFQAACELLHDDATDKPGPSSSGSGDAQVSKDELAFVLITVTLVASYFGDPPIVKRTVLAIVDDVFASNASKTSEAEATDSESSNPLQPEIALLPSVEAAARLVQHLLVQQYIRGQLTGVSAQPHS